MKKLLIILLLCGCSLKKQPGRYGNILPFKGYTHGDVIIGTASPDTMKWILIGTLPQDTTKKTTIVE